MKIVIGADQGGVELKNAILQRLLEAGYETINLGIDDTVSIDYPDKAEEVCNYLLNNACDLGILICGTGIGISISANKVPGIRAALVSDCYSAKMARLHNDANVLCMGGRTLGSELAWDIVQNFLGASFEGGRHARRVNKINDLDKLIKL